MKNKKYLILSFIIPIFIILTYIIIFQDFNFCNNVIVNDLASQYDGLLSYLKNAILGKTSFLYSFSKGLGGNMISTIAYYLISPLNLLLLFFKNIHNAIALGMILRFCLCDLTMCIYLKHKYNKLDITTVLFSTIYAFSGYMINYYFNIMWIDILILLPLIIMYLDNIIDGKFNIKFIILLSLSLIFNYYLGYMVYLFVFLYSIYEILIKYNIKVDKNKIFKIIKYILISMFVSGIISSIVLLPTALDMINNILRYSSSNDFIRYSIENIFMLISRFFINSGNLGVRLSPQQINIYITIFGLVLIIKYFFNNKFKTKEKILTASMLLILVLSVIFDFLNLVWHGFSYPNGYNYRFSFCFIFFLINIAYKQFINNNKLNLKTLILIVISFALISLTLINKYSYLPNYLILISLGLFVIYIFILNNKNIKWLIITLVFIEIIFNFNLTFINNKKIKTVNLSYSYKDEICNYFKESNIDNRISINNFMTYNEGFNCNINDISLSVSTNNNKYYNFMSNVGYTVTYSSVLKNFNQGPFIDSILGVKNIFQMGINHDLGYEFTDIKNIGLLNNKDLFYIYNHVNNNALSIGYVIENEKINYSTNVFENQNQLAKKMSGIDLNIFEPITLNKIGKNKYKFETNEKYYYFYNYYPIPINQTKYMNAYFNDGIALNLYAFEKGIVRINNNFSNNIKTVEFQNINDYHKKYFEPLIYTFNYENYQIIMDKLKEKQIKVTKINGNKFSGNINLEKDEKLMLSIINENGWNVKVNGNKVNVDTAYDTFIMLDLKKGNNNIEMYFIPPGLITGIILSLSGVGLCIFINQKNKKNKVNYEEKI